MVDNLFDEYIKFIIRREQIFLLASKKFVKLLRKINFG